MSTPITRETFISPDHVKIAATHSTMYKMMPDGVVEEVPVPARVRKSGILLEGYTVDFVLDPSTIVATLKGNGLSTVEELPADMLKDMIAAMNDPKNLTMVPIELSKGKRKLIEAAERSMEEAEEFTGITTTEAVLRIHQLVHHSG